MKKSFKLLSLILAIACSLAFVGCGNNNGGNGGNSGNSGNGGNSGKPSDGGKAAYTVDFDLPATTETSLKISIPDNEPEKKKINAMIEAFNAKYPKITITTSTFTIDSYATTILQQGKAGLLADIVWCNSSNFYVPVASGYALNLNDYVKQAKEAGAFDYDADYTEAFKKMGKSGGNLYAIARSTDSVVTFYNKEILKAAGVDLSVFKNGWTWSDFLSVCEQLRQYYDKNGQKKAYPIDANIGWESVGYPIIKALGGEVFNEKGEFCLTKEVSDKVYAFIRELVEKRYIPSENDSVTSFESGTGAMLFQSASLDVYQSKATHTDKFDVVSFPLIGENPQIGFGFAGYFVNDAVRNNRNKLNAALAFMTYLMSYDGQQVMAEKGGLNLPSIRNDLSETNPDAKWCAQYKDKFNVAAYTYGGSYKVGVDFLQYVKPTLANAVIKALNGYTGSYCIDKDKTADKAYNLFKAEIEEVLEDV